MRRAIVCHGSMFKSIARLAVAVVIGGVGTVAPATAQTAPPPGWAGSAGAGLSLTQGNSDTTSVNLSLEVKHDSGSDVLFKGNVLFLRADSEGKLTTNRLAGEARLDREMSERTSLYVQAQYLRDSFKAIDYLVSPTLGVGHVMVKNDRTELAVDAGAGVVWEKNPDQGVKTDGALTAGQNFKHQLTTTTTLTQRIAALWKAANPADALYTAGVGLAASVTSAIQMKVELLDTYKTRPPSANVVKNDVAVLVSFLYKFD